MRNGATGLGLTRQSKNRRALRGASGYGYGPDYLLSSCRGTRLSRVVAATNFGFRCALVGGSGRVRLASQFWFPRKPPSPAVSLEVHPTAFTPEPARRQGDGHDCQACIDIAGGGVALDVGQQGRWHRQAWQTLRSLRQKPLPKNLIADAIDLRRRFVRASSTAAGALVPWPELEKARPPLTLVDTQITDAGLKDISQVAEAREAFACINTKITDAGLKECQVAEAEALLLHPNHRRGSQGYCQVAELAGLLANTKITDAGSRRWPIQKLNLTCDTQVTTRVSRISQAAEPHTLHLDTQITDEGAAVKEGVAQCNIDH